MTKVWYNKTTGNGSVLMMQKTCQTGLIFKKVLWQHQQRKAERNVTNY